MDVEYSKWKESDRDKWGYLHSLRVSFGTFNSDMQDFYFKNMWQTNTKAQRDDVWNRFREFDKYRVASPFFPPTGEKLARPDFSRWRRPESLNGKECR